MLKIRDDVDLKELERLGFKEYYDYYYYSKVRLQADLCINKRNKTSKRFNPSRTSRESIRKGGLIWKKKTKN